MNRSIIKTVVLVLMAALLAVGSLVGAGCSEEESKALNAAFQADTTSGKAPLVVQFTDKSTGEVTGWEWDFDNDGTVDSTVQSPSYTYDTLGKYTVSLKVTGPDGSDTEKKDDYINVTVTTIKFPLFMPYSGSAAQGYSPVDAMARVYIEWLEANDPIPGVKLEVVTYDSKMDPSQAIPGYEYLTGQGALFVANTDTYTADTLKDIVDEDKFPIFLMSGTKVATDNPGYVFCTPPGYYDQTQPLLVWIKDNWDYDTKGKPKIGVFGWNMGYGNDRKDAVEDYIADYPDSFTYVGAQMAPYGTSSWTTEIEALKDCDYIMTGAFAGGAVGFFGGMRASGYDKPTFMVLGSDLGFISIYLANPGKEAMDGTLWATDGGYWKTDLDEISVLARELLDDWFDDYADIRDYILDGGNPGTSAMLCHMMNVVNVIREAVEDLDDPDDLTGEMIYDAATTMTVEYDGYPAMDYHNGKRALTIQEKIFEYSAVANDWHVVTDEWITCPRYE